jgi:beta-lactamase superfamily II metal-dependent hydrolase
MSIVKSLSIGEGDMYYIKHNTDNFTIIDCCLVDDNKYGIVEELKAESEDKQITRFISTHPDEDHVKGIAYLDNEMPIRNFYCVKNEAIKEEASDSFRHYCSLRDSDKAFFVKNGSSRRWMNKMSEERRSSGISIVWPNPSNKHYQEELENARLGISFNNISLVARYSVSNSATMLWLGDLETSFMEKIANRISLSQVQIVFAPHHGRKSGKIPNSWLAKLHPNIIVIGEAPSR